MPEIINFRRIAKELFSAYLNHQSFKAHDGVFAAAPAAAGEIKVEGGAARGRSLSNLAGVKLSAAEAGALWPRLLEHKWYLSERLGRDVGLHVAAADYFENIQPPRVRAPRRAHGGGLPPRLPMMMPFGERP